MKEARDKFDNVTKGESIMEKVYIGAKDYYDKVSKLDVDSTKNNMTMTLLLGDSLSQGAAPPNGTAVNHNKEGDSSLTSRGVTRNIQRALKFAVGDKASSSNSSNNNSNVGNNAAASTETRRALTETGGGGAMLNLYDYRRDDLEDDLLITEQDVYAAADALELLKDTYGYFTGHDEDDILHKNKIDPFQDKGAILDRRRWKSTASTLRNIEHAHERGVDGMGLLIKAHLLKAGPAIRMKRPLVARGDVTITTVVDPRADTGKGTSSSSIMQVHYESAAEARMRFNAAVQNRDLMKSVGEYEEYLPLTTRMVRELRAIFECLSEKKTFWGCVLGDNAIEEMNGIINVNMRKKLVINEVTRTEAMGSGHYSNMCMVCRSSWM